MTTTTSASKFLDERLRLYSAHSNVRGIPFIGDGFKQASRKALWGMLKRGEGADKDTVERIAAFAASATDYHHGVGSMESTIVNMGQSFAGSNNVPLFEAFGQFGNRLNKKPSASRYIKAKLSPIYRSLFKKEDDLILEQNISNDLPVEPRFFIPVLPLVLVNGAEGMGTGHSTYILSYNPKDIKQALLKLLDGKTPKPGTLLPYWNGFKGTVSRDAETGQVVTVGKLQREDKRGGEVITVTELPVGIQSDAYETHLQKLEDKGLISGYDNRSDEGGFDFVIQVPRGSKLLELTDDELAKQLKLISRETENLTVWNPDGVLHRYACVESLLTDWYGWRLERYEDRRQALIKKLQADIDLASEKVRFIRFYLANVTFFRDTGKAEITRRLEAEKFREPDKLLSMPIYNLTRDQIAKLEKELDELQGQVKQLQGDTPAAMFTRELKSLEV
jgi:DNA gyrase/topoisomerase IV subunit A